MRLGKVGRNGDRFPVKEDEQPEQEVEEQGGKSEDADTHARLDATRCEGNSYMTGEHDGEASRRKSRGRGLSEGRRSRTGWLMGRLF